MSKTWPHRRRLDFVSPQSLEDFAVLINGPSSKYLLAANWCKSCCQVAWPQPSSSGRGRWWGGRQLLVPVGWRILKHSLIPRVPQVMALPGFCIWILLGEPCCMEMWWRAVCLLSTSYTHTWIYRGITMLWTYLKKRNIGKTSLMTWFK